MRINGDVKYSTTPNVSNMNEWKLGMIRAVQACSGRIDNLGA